MGVYSVHRYGSVYEVEGVSGQITICTDSKLIKMIDFKENLKIRIMLNPPGDPTAPNQIPEMKLEPTIPDVPESEIIEELDSIDETSQIKATDNTIMKTEALSKESHIYTEQHLGEQFEPTGFCVSYSENPVIENDVENKNRKPTKVASDSYEIQSKIDNPAKCNSDRVKTPKTLTPLAMKNDVSNSKKPNKISASALIAQSEKYKQKLSTHKIQPKKSGSRTVKRENVECNVCLKIFPNKIELINHKLSNEVKTRRDVYSCSLCVSSKHPQGDTYYFRWKAALLVHHHLYHNSKKKNSDININTKEIHNFSKLACFGCEETFTSVPCLTKHAKEHTGEATYKCCRCGQEVEDWDRHAKKNHGTSRFKCLTCQVSFKTRGDLKTHQGTHAISCGLCGKNFGSKSALSAHIRISHQDSPYKCSVCSKYLNNKESFDQHMRHHRYYKFSQCPVCGSFVGRLDRHMELHEQEDKQVKNYACDQCPKSFTKSSTLKNHYRLHTGERPYSCDYCPKSFRLHSTLGVHIKTHTKEKNFACEICGKRTVTSYNLKIHKRIHSSTKAFICYICQHGFNYKASLKSHMMSRHSVELDSVSINSNSSDLNHKQRNEEYNSYLKPESKVEQNVQKNATLVGSNPLSLNTDQSFDYESAIIDWPLDAR